MLRIQSIQQGCKEALASPDTLTLSAKLSSQSASEKLLKSSVLLGLSGGLDVESGLAFDTAGVGGLTVNLLGVRKGCKERTGVFHTEAISVNMFLCSNNRRVQ